MDSISSGILGQNEGHQDGYLLDVSGGHLPVVDFVVVTGRSKDVDPFGGGRLFIYLFIGIRKDLSDEWTHARFLFGEGSSGLGLCKAKGGHDGRRNASAALTMTSPLPLRPPFVHPRPVLLLVYRPRSSPT